MPGTLPAHPEAGKELSWAGEQHFFVSFLGHQPWFRAIPLSLSLLAGVKKGHDREQEEQDQVLPLLCLVAALTL